MGSFTKISSYTWQLTSDRRQVAHRQYKFDHDVGWAGRFR